MKWSYFVLLSSSSSSSSFFYLHTIIEGKVQLTCSHTFVVLLLLFCFWFCFQSLFASICLEINRYNQSNLRQIEIYLDSILLIFFLPCLCLRVRVYVCMCVCVYLCVRECVLSLIFYFSYSSFLVIAVSLRRITGEKYAPPLSKVIIVEKK